MLKKQTQWWKIKNDEKCFSFTLKALFVLKILTVLSWHFGHVEKPLDNVNFKIYDATTWETKQVQYTYCPISRDVNAFRQWNLVSQWNITREIYFLKNLKISHKIWWKNQSQKNQNRAHLWINSLTFFTVCFDCMPSWGLSAGTILAVIACDNRTQSIALF